MPDPTPSHPSARRRDRRGRGLRGPGLGVPGEGPRRPTRGDTRRERFDALALGVIAEVDGRWQDHLGLVEYSVEDTPVIPDDWHGESVPLSSLVRGSGSRPSRLVLFRRPIEHRCSGRAELEAFLHSLVVEQVAHLLALDPEDVDPRYER